MEHIDLCGDWLFFRTEAPVPWWETPPAGVRVDLPHDFSIAPPRDPKHLSGAGGGYFQTGMGVYDRTLTVPDAWLDKRIVLVCEGAMGMTTLHVNNQLATRHPYGFTEFHTDIGRFLRPGANNRIRFTVCNHAQPNCRWYAGSGLYRRVFLLVGDKACIHPWNVFHHTVSANAEKAELLVTVTLDGEPLAGRQAELHASLADESGRKVADGTAMVPPVDGKHPDGGESASACLLLQVDQPALWSPDHPALYRLTLRLRVDGRTADTWEGAVGLRHLTMDATHGLRINGEPTKLRGGCVHGECGILGAAAHRGAEARKVRLLKASGFNAVRCAHNPPSTAFLEACDRQGLLVVDELFDTWREAKNPYDYNLFFDAWWERDLASVVRRDRNHPSVILWSTGNEAPERSGRSDGYAWSARLADAVRALDDTRGVTCALNGIGADPLVDGLQANLLADGGERDFWEEKGGGFVAPLDVVGYNYLGDRYERDARKHPNRMICGMEAFPQEALVEWERVLRHPQVIGSFVWSAIDYLGEAGFGRSREPGDKAFLAPYPWKTAWCGDLDLCGFKRPQSRYRDCVWGVAQAPWIGVLDPVLRERTVTAWGWPELRESWNWHGDEGRTLAVAVYATADEVELLLNGKSLGSRPAGYPASYRAAFDVPFEPGTLTCVARAGGRETGRTILETAGPAVAVHIEAEVSDGVCDDLHHLVVTVCDAEGRRVPHAQDRLVAEVTGAGRMLAFGSADPCGTDSFAGGTCTAYEGRALLIVAASGQEAAGTTDRPEGDVIRVRVRLEATPDAMAEAVLACRA